MTDRQLMQQALDALNSPNFGVHSRAIAALHERLAHCDRCGKKLGGEGDIHTCTPDPIGDAQDRLIAELAAQPEQEPVAWMHTMIDDVVIGHRPADLNRHPERWKPLVYANTTPHAAQRQGVGLTPEEIDKTHETQVWDARRSFARAIEAKLKEKNT